MESMVAGGEGGNNTAELYNMTNGSWSYTGSMNVSRYLHAAILLPNGKVLVAGGFSSTQSYTIRQLENGHTPAR